MVKPMRPKTAAKGKTPSKQTATDPVEVFCRIRPLEPDQEHACVSRVSDTVVQLNPLDSGRTTQHTFKHVFDTDRTQKEVYTDVALPLCRDLLQGKNGLVFTYGITGSGKTHTMMGSKHDPGILVRCIDVVFNSIQEFQAKKFVFKPDRMNGFEPQLEADAMMDRQRDLHSQINQGYKTPKTPKRKEADSDLANRNIDTTRITEMDEDNLYSVFVSYVEIYNNYIYDFLEDSRTIQTKILREDCTRNMYVHAVTEVEVRSPEDAFECLQRGQKRRRVAHTTLNTESSRSHSVFTIRVVQAPIDESGEEIYQEKSAICISQLSLVDLAGSERVNRTKGTGERIREAGNINNSLMVLRNCIEVLRDNQKSLTTKMVPYRDSRVTHLFKNYFDGEGKIRMVICVNPRVGDYDETIHVMKFAEATQEVQIARAKEIKHDLGFIPGRRKANQRYKEAMKEYEAEVACVSPVSYDLLPDYDVDNYIQLDQHSLTMALQHRASKRRKLSDQFKDNGLPDFRGTLSSHLDAHRTLTFELESSRAVVGSRDQEIAELRRRVHSADSNKQSQYRSDGAKDHKIATLEQQVGSLRTELHGAQSECRSLRSKYKDQLTVTEEKTKKRYKDRFRQAATPILDENKHLKSQIDLINQLTGRGGSNAQGSRSRPPLTPSISDSIISTPTHRSQDTDTESCTVRGRASRFERGQRGPPVPAKPTIGLRSTPMSTAVINPRHRRSRSTDADTWLEHRPLYPVPTNTVMQPVIKNKKSTTHLDNPRELAKHSKYILTRQEQDTDGELETRLIKGDVIPTCGGGSQVVFNDVEVLKQRSPVGKLKRDSDGKPKYPHS